MTNETQLFESTQNAQVTEPKKPEAAKDTTPKPKTPKKPAELPSYYSVKRCIEYSNGYMFGIDDNGNETPIKIVEKTIRGSVSNYSDGFKMPKGNVGQTEKDIEAPNCQTIDYASLASNEKVLKLSFSVNILPVDISQQSCNNMKMLENVETAINQYKTNGGFEELAKMVTWRLANGSALWRNGYGINKKVKIEMVVGANGETEEFNFNSSKFSLNKPPKEDEIKGNDFQKLSQSIQDTFEDKTGTKVLMLRVSCFVEMNYGMEVYPSQDFIQKNSESNSKKLLYRVLYKGRENGESEEIAGMHSQKIGAAIRAFDIWYAEVEKYGPISMEPFGYSHTYQNAFRKPNKGDLYSVLKEFYENPIAKNHDPEKSSKFIESCFTGKDGKIIDNKFHHLMGCFIRGGVFSGSAEKEPKEEIANTVKTSETQSSED